MEHVDLNLVTALDALLHEVSVTGAAKRLGLSAPAMSHALGRLRRQLGDPLLVRAGRNMVLTPRAEALRPKVRELRVAAHEVLSGSGPFAPERLTRTFVIHASDNVLAVLAKDLDRLLSKAPGVTVRFRPNLPDEPRELREGRADLAIGIYTELPPELRLRKLYSDRFVCAVRGDHPTVGNRLTLAQFLALSQVQVAPKGRPGGQLDTVLAQHGVSRQVARAVPFFLSALLIVSESDAVVTLPERVAVAVRESFRLKLLEPPVPLRPYTLSLLWHPRLDGDAPNRWLREVVIEAARIAAGGSPRRLDGGAGTPPSPRKQSRGNAG